MPFLDEVRIACASAASFEDASARVVKLLRTLPGYDWVGIYMVDGDELVLGAWDGPEATEHVRIPIGRGICGAAASSNQTIIVHDVNEDPRYLSCFIRTRSEIVVPISIGTRVLGEIDVDGDEVGQFGPSDRHLCEAVAAELARAWARTRRAGARGEATRAVHAGEGADPLARPLHAPIYGSVTYEFEDAAELERFLADESRGFIYGRWSNPTVRACERKLARLLHAEESRLFASGMAAIASATLGLARRGQRIVHSGALYGGTFHFFYDLLPRLGIEVAGVAPGDAAALARALEGPETAFLYAETITNPTMRVADLDALAAAARARGVPLVLDDTFATPHLVRALERGATLVIESATKALGGHADLAAGVVGGGREIVERIDRTTARYLGATAGAHEAALLARGLRTFPLRAARQCANALAIARALAADGRVAAVSYPGLESHPEYALARRLFGDAGFGSMVSFDAGSLERAKRFFDAVEIFRRAASLGSVESLVSLPLLSSHQGIPPGKLAELGIAPGLVRLSVGIEDAEDLVADVRQALD